MIHPLRTACVLIIATLALATPAFGQSRLALVIGNDTYQHVEPLKKAGNDARAVAQSLGRLGFAVTLGLNVARRDFVRAVAEFEGKIRPGDIAFVFYSGHGVEIEGANYLLPIDIPKVGAGQQGILRDEAISTTGLIERLKARGTRAQVVVLDACRDNPFKDNLGRSVGGSRGLAKVPGTNGVFIVYSAGVGETALDRMSDNDANPNSVFTRTFLPLLEDTNKSMVQVVKETSSQVRALAGTISHQQSVGYYDEVDGDLFLARFGGASSSPPPPRPTPPPSVAVAPPQPQLPPPPPPPVVQTPPVAAGLIFADSDRRYLNRAEIQRLSRDQLRIARNEIYARRGRYFQDQSLTVHFSRFSWYRPTTWEPSLNAYEKANVALIQSLER